jgi:flavin-dependent dehydrogenase
MRTEHKDVAIVGGGPGGSNAALKLKQLDPTLDVAVYERGKEPSSQCAGGLGIPFKKHMGYQPPDKVVKSPIEEVIIASPNEEMTLEASDLDLSNIDWVEDENEIGWVVDRHAWDQYALELASDEGAEINKMHTVKEIGEKNESILVNDRVKNEDIHVNASYIILANGVNWELATQAGFDESKMVPPKSEMHMGLQYEFKDPDYFSNYGENSIYLEFNRDYSPNGYIWSFASDEGYTKWGSGTPLSHDFNVKEGLNKYFEDNGKMEMKEKTTRKTTNAIIPTAQPLESAVNGNVALVGDTAHFCDSLHGGGMLFGARGAKSVARAIAEGNLSNYDGYWKDDFLDTLQHRFILRDLIHNMDNSEYDRFVKSIKEFNVEGVNPDKEIPRMMWHCLKNDPGIFGKSAKEATKTMARQKFGL